MPTQARAFSSGTCRPPAGRAWASSASAPSRWARRRRSRGRPSRTPARARSRTTRSCARSASSRRGTSGLLELRVGLVPRVLETEVQAGHRQHGAGVVVPGDLALVALVEQQAPGARLRLHLVRAVEDRVVAPVLRDPVLLSLVLTRLDHQRVQVLEVRDELRVPGLHEAALGEVPHPPDVRTEDVPADTRLELPERVGLVGHDGELRLVLRILLVVRGEHGLAAVVAVTRPVEHLQTSALGCSRSSAAPAAVAARRATLHHRQPRRA